MKTSFYAGLGLIGISFFSDAFAADTVPAKPKKYAAASAPKKDNRDDIQKQIDSQNTPFIKQNREPAGRFIVSGMLGIAPIEGIQLGVMGSGKVYEHGFIPFLNNSISVEGSADFGQSVFWPISYHFYNFAVVGRWDFHISPVFTAYGALGVGTRITSLSSSSYNIAYSSRGIYPDFRVGCFYDINSMMAWRAEIDEGEYALKGGLAFRF